MPRVPTALTFSVPRRAPPTALVVGLGLRIGVVVAITSQTASPPFPCSRPSEEGDGDGRESSSVKAVCFMVLRIRRPVSLPRSSPRCPSTREYGGMIRSRRIMLPNWPAIRLDESMRVSSKTSIPSSSQASSNSGVGDCGGAESVAAHFLQLPDPEVLHRVRQGHPRPAWSWWLQVPLILTDCP